MTLLVVSYEYVLVLPLLPHAVVNSFLHRRYLSIDQEDRCTGAPLSDHSDTDCGQYDAATVPEDSICHVSA